jgi:Protein of unknown function (DUF2384)
VDAQDADRLLAGREIAAERIDRLAEWLGVALGPHLAAFAAGVSERHLTAIAQGEEEPAADEERRLRNLYAVASFLAARDGAGTAYTWLTEPNPELSGRTPASALHEGDAPETVWLASPTAF